MIPFARMSAKHGFGRLRACAELGTWLATTSPDDDGAADGDKEARIEPGFHFRRAIFHQHPIKPTSTVKKQDAFDRISAGRSAFRVDDLLELRRLFDKRKLGSAEAENV